MRNATLDDACTFLVGKALEISDAIGHMHSKGIYHLDVKPANILISTSKQAILTDLGASVHADELADKTAMRIHFTWTYAHPELTDIVSQPASITGGGLKASAQVPADTKLARFDLFAFGRTLQQCLALLETEFGERCHASYGFRFLHLIAALLLDGHNAPGEEGVRIRNRHGVRFVSDVPLEYPTAFFRSHKILTAGNLVGKLTRYTREFSWNAAIPELDQWPRRTLNSGIGSPTCFSTRVANLFGHPCLRRLKAEAQLGWMREVYPFATHNRWSHSIGVFSACLRYYNALLADPDVPTLRIVMEKEDLLHAMVAAILHDVGQVAFGHDLEEACPELFNHVNSVERLLDEDAWGEPTLRQTIQRNWEGIEVDRVLNILQNRGSDRPIDALAADILNGPVDADKFDYIPRDSAACGVPYGNAVDADRFLKALSVGTKLVDRQCQLALSYKAKGGPAIESLLLARYQMFGAVYWHHTFRCIQSMFSHSVAATFGRMDPGFKIKLGNTTVAGKTIQDLLFHWVVCGKSLQRVASHVKKIPAVFHEDPPLDLGGERSLEFIWKFASKPIRELLRRLGRRDLYKRIWELRVGDLGQHGDYYAMRAPLVPEKRPELAHSVETGLLDSIHKKMQQREGPRESVSESEARKRLQILANGSVPRIVIDFPTRGIPQEKNFPVEIGDSERKYLSGVGAERQQRQIFHVVRQLQTNAATIRVFAAPELHELVIRYLDPTDVESCVGEAIPSIRTR